MNKNIKTKKIEILIKKKKKFIKLLKKLNFEKKKKIKILKFNYLKYISTLNDPTNSKYKNLLIHKFYIWNSLLKMNFKFHIYEIFKTFNSKYNFRKYFNFWYNNNIWVSKQKRIRFRKKKPIYKKIYNYNIEMNKKILAYTIISNEFFNSQKFMISKPHFFNYKINKFIKNFN